MKTLGRLFLKGLAVILPLALTIYIFYWLGLGAETLARGALERVLGTGLYFPGMGIVAGFALVLLVGLVTRAWVVRKIIGLGESLLLRVPLVKTIYGGLKDLMDFVSSTTERKLAGQAVMVTLGEGVRLMGLVTRQDFEDLPAGIGGDETVGVYLQMSYQLGGFTVFVPRDRVEAVDMGVDDAMSFILTAGMSTGGEDGAQPSASR